LRKIEETTSIRRLLPNCAMPDETCHLLTLNCHEAWVYQLASLGYGLDIIDGLPGRYCSSWDTNVRPVPNNANLVTLDQVLSSRSSYYCIIAHNLTDLLDLKTLPGPRILVLHSTLTLRARQHKLRIPLDQMRTAVRQYLDLIGGHAVAVSPLKGNSWGLADDIVENGVDPDEYPPWSGEELAGVRVSSQISNKRECLLWNLHEEAFQDIEVRLVGFNPDMPGVTPSRSWDDLKSTLRSHRFYIHTAHPQLEDGYNMASLEAMAAGLPILGNRHPTSPVQHGINGFLSEDPEELRKYALLLLRDKDLAGRMGDAARRTVSKYFSITRFCERFKASIETARTKWETREVRDSYCLFQRTGKNGDPSLLTRSGQFIRLAESFHGYLKSGETEKGVAVLNEMMKLLGMFRDITVSSIDHLIELIVDVSYRLRDLQDNKAEMLLLQGAHMLGALRDSHQRDIPDFCTE
jgi:pentatricopeptide repeat protein